MCSRRVLLLLAVAFMGAACSSVPAVKVADASVTPPVEMVRQTEVVEDVDEPEVELVVIPATPVLVVVPIPPIKKPVSIKKPVPVVAKPIVVVKPARPLNNVISKPVVVSATVVLPPIGVPSPPQAFRPYGTPVVTDWRVKTIPENIRKLFVVVKNVVSLMWSNLKEPSYILAQIEQETCISPTHSKCGSTKAELKTSREYGFGFGQTTIAYNKDGTERFNVWKELKQKDPTLNEKWTWDNRYDPEMQMRALLVKNKMNHSSIRFDTANEFEKLAFAFVTYNSGSVLTDRRLCLAQRDCDPSRWFSTASIKGVEAYSTKSNVAATGYGKSFREISREYPYQVMYTRRLKYIPYVDLPERAK